MDDLVELVPQAKKNAANDNDPSAIGWAYKHLNEAKTKAGRPDAGYFWHFKLAINEFFFLLVAITFDYL